MNNLTANQQKVADELIDLVMQRVYTKIVPVLSEEEISKLEQLKQQDPSCQSMREFLLTKVPDFDKMVEEEINLLKSELSSAGT